MKEEKECCLQLMVFHKRPQETKQVYSFLKKYKGQVIISAPIGSNNIKGGLK